MAINHFVPYKENIEFKIREVTGIQEIRWSKASVLCTYLYLALTVFVMFMRPDFPNLAVGLLAFYFISAQALSAVTFKLLLICTIVAAVYDVIWLLMFMGTWGGSSAFADGAEVGMRRFCLFASFVSLFLKAPVAIIYWRNAIN
jgi:hypothetical protein